MDKITIDNFVHEGELSEFSYNERYDGIEYSLKMYFPTHPLRQIWPHPAMADVKVEMGSGYGPNGQKFVSGKLHSIEYVDNYMGPSYVTVKFFSSFDNKPRTVSEPVNRLKQIEDL